HRKVGLLVPDVELSQSFLDGEGSGPHLLLFTVDGDGDLPAVPHRDLVCRLLLEKKSGNDLVVRTYLDAPVVKDVLDAASEGVHGLGLAIDGEVDGVVKRDVGGTAAY